MDSPSATSARGLLDVNMVTGWPAEPPALGLRPAQPGDHAVPDQVPLEYGDRGQDVE